MYLLCQQLLYGMSSPWVCLRQCVGGFAEWWAWVVGRRWSTCRLAQFVACNECMSVFLHSRPLHIQYFARRARGYDQRICRSQSHAHPPSLAASSRPTAILTDRQTGTQSSKTLRGITLAMPLSHCHPTGLSDPLTRITTVGRANVAQSRTRTNVSQSNCHWQWSHPSIHPVSHLHTQTDTPAIDNRHDMTSLSVHSSTGHRGLCGPDSAAANTPAGQSSSGTSPMTAFQVSHLHTCKESLSWLPGCL
mmetsp:Transcript_37053/g.92967  ORF Transcript_37053/g.92967 Transcript_37053/m.92967 type:complete len:248 (-) Transcript_37053:211-954(-)